MTWEPESGAYERERLADLVRQVSVAADEIARGLSRLQALVRDLSPALEAAPRVAAWRPAQGESANAPKFRPSPPVEADGWTSTPAAPPAAPPRVESPATEPGSWPFRVARRAMAEEAASPEDQAMLAAAAPASRSQGGEETPPARDSVTDDVRDAVRRAVEQARAELASGPAVPGENAPAEPAPGPVSPGWGWPSASADAWTSDASREGSWPKVPPKDAPRTAGKVDDSPGAADESEGDVRDQVRRAVEMAKAELGAGLSDLASDEPRGEAAAPPEVEDRQAPAPVEDDRARDEVQRAVEMARRELFEPEEKPKIDIALLSGESVGLAKEIEERLVQVAPQITIEDTSGRVELVRVYQSLAALGRASHANLANFTPYSVTVSLESGSAPSVEELKAAIEGAFGRPCQISTDGTGRMGVKLLGPGKAA